MYFLCLLKYNMLHIISSHTEHNIVIDNIINNIIDNIIVVVNSIGNVVI